MRQRHVLKWSGQHFLLRFAHAALSLRLLRVDGGSKAVDALDFAELPVKAEGLEPLPPDARLVAAKEVVNAELGICMPLLVFQANGSADAGSTSATDRKQSPARKKRRRHSDANALSSSFYFFVLAKTRGAGVNCVLQFVNRVDLPVESSPVSNSQEHIITTGAPLLQVEITDGPHIVVHQPAAHELSILKLQRTDARFFVWRSGVKLRAIGDRAVATEAPVELRSCALVGESASDSPHLLLQFASVGDVSAAEGLSEAAQSEPLESCSYIPKPSPEKISDDQVTCCALLDRGARLWDSGSAFELWPTATRSQPAMVTQLPIGVAPSTLVVTGSTRNTLYVHDCGVLLLSFVLPKTPCEIVQVDGGDARDTFHLAVQCCDVNRSFFLLSFNAAAFQPSMRIVQAFSHVGDALVGEFTSQSSAEEILLINHVQIDEEAETPASDLLLVKKSVLICKKHAAEKHSIHRLRVDDAASKDKARGSKRSRSSREKDESTGASVRFIERIKFGSRERTDRGRGGDDSDDGRSKHLVSQTQLLQLTKSLEKRLENGIRELDRLKLIVADKRNMVHRLDFFVADEWWRSQQDSPGGLLIAAVQPDDQASLNSGSRSQIEMRTLVSAPGAAPRSDEPMQQLSTPMYSLQTLVSLANFRVVGFTPASSLFRLEVVLRNRSARSLRSAFVSLVGDGVASSLGSAVVSGMQSASSVQAIFYPESENADGLATFVAEIQLPPTFAILRAQQRVKASVWLHCNDTREQPTISESAAAGNLSSVESSPQSSPSCSLFVGSVEISPREFVLTHESSNRHLGSSSGAPRESEKLLFLSAGTNLNHVFQSQRETKPHRSTPIALMQSQGTLAPRLVRPSFTLATLAICARELAKYHLSQLVFSLPSDVYSMVNPLTEARVRDVAALLKAIRIETVVMQRRSVATPSSDSEARARSHATDEDAMSVDSDASRAHQQWQLLTNFRQLQKATDLRAARLLQDLQKRANYHSMWHASP